MADASPHSAPLTIGPAIPATSSAADAPTPAANFGPAIQATSSAADVSLAAAEIGPAIPATSSAADAGSAGVSWFAAGANHVDAPVQWFANFVVTLDSFGAPMSPTPSLALPSVTETVAAAPVASVFSDSSGSGFSASTGWGGADDSFAVSELPFMHDVTFDDVPVYTASSDTPWIFTTDFTGDGWFFA